MNLLFTIGIVLFFVVTWPIAGAFLAKTVSADREVPVSWFVAMGWVGFLFYAFIVWPVLGVFELGEWLVGELTWGKQRIFLWYRVTLARIAPEHFAKDPLDFVRAFGGFARTHDGRGFVLVAVPA